MTTSAHILLSERMAPALPGLHADYPDLTFATIPMDGPIRDEYFDANILWMSAMSDSLFDSILAEADGLGWIQLTAAGFDWILRPALDERIDQGVWVTRSVNSFNVPIAEFVVAAILSSARSFPELAAAQDRHEWVRVEASEIGGSNVVVLGTGAIGGQIAWRCEALGARVTGVSRSGAPAEHFRSVVSVDRLHEVLPTCDTLVIAAPLTAETHHLISSAEFALLQPSSLLVNIGRGAVVDTAEMVAALQEGRLARAVVDVFEEEPLPASSPLWDVPNLIVTPHTSFRGDGNLTRLERDFRGNLDRFLAGEPLDGVMKSRVLGY